MPKNTEVEHMAMNRDFPLDFPELGSDGASGSGERARMPQGKGKHTNKKVLGRLRNKKLLEAQAQAAEKTIEEGGMTEKEPEIKRPRPEKGNETDDGAGAVTTKSRPVIE
jgi:hypothetical protein